MEKKFLPQAVFLCCAAISITPWVSSGTALFMGVALALASLCPYREAVQKLTPRLLSYSIVALGAGMNLAVVGAVGKSGVGYTAVGIGLTLLLGTILGKTLGMAPKISKLITVGTAICGGSAIAAVAPVLEASAVEISVSLGIVFVLNAVALFLFPWIGHSLDLSQHQFGLWSALAIHDTSSVVGATMQYGAEALQTGTTVKLARALWIIPLSVAYGFFRPGEKGGFRLPKKKPWFILGFLLMAAFFSYFPSLQPVGNIFATVGKHVLVLTLFLIGSQLSQETLRSVGPKPFLHGVVLWIVAASCTLGAILMGWIS